MVRYVGWLANTMLFVLCCFLVANTANAIIAALLTEPPAVVSPEQTNTGAQQSSWKERQVIVRRNLFHSSTLTPKPPEPEPVIVPDEIEETELPLKLWGTIASGNPDWAVASVEELDSRNKGAQAVSVGDLIQSAEVLAIERRRIVLLENGIRRALTLDDEEMGKGRTSLSSRSVRGSVARAKRRSHTAPARTRRSARKSMADRVKKLADDRFELDREDVKEAMANPASLYTQARILPKVDEDGEFSGIEISAIKAGSIFEQVGIEDGDVITAIGGEPISSVGDSQGFLSAFSDGESIDLTIRSANGEISTRQFQFPPQ